MKHSFLLHMFNVRKSIMSRLFVTLMAMMIVSFVLIFSLCGNNIIEVVRELSTSHLIDVMHASNNRFDSSIKLMHQSLTNLAENQHVISHCTEHTLDQADSDDELNRKLLDDYNIFTSDIYGIAIVDRTGDSHTIGSVYVPSDTSVFFSAAEDSNDGIFLMQNMYNRQNGNYRITLVQAVKYAGQIVGVVTMDISQSFLVRHFGMSNMRGMLKTVIAADNNQVVYCSDSTIGAEDLQLLITQAKDYHKTNHIMEIPVGGTSYMVLAERCSSYNRWTNIMFFPKDSITSQYNQYLLYTLLAGIGIFLFTVFAAAGVSYGMTKKLRLLDVQISNINLNNLNYKPIEGLQNGNDEIGNISKQITKMAQKISCQVEELKDLEEKKRSYEIQVLKSQISPHFLYNTLWLIGELAQKQHQTEIYHITSALIPLLNYSVNKSDSLVTVSEELDCVKNYVAIMQAKFLNNINLVLDVEPEVLSCLTLRMVLQPIVENSIKYGLCDRADNYIVIKGYRNDDDVVLKVLDNGNGIEPDRLKSIMAGLKENGGQHLGLRNVHKRLQLTFGPKYGIHIYSIPSLQTTVTITFPQLTKEDQNDVPRTDRG